MLLLLAATTLSAQSILKGDMNNDNEVTIADVTSVVNVVLGKSPMETINVGGSPYLVDNSLVVGTWYAPDGTSFTLNEDGTTNFPNAATFKFRPYQGTLMLFNASGRPLKTLVLNEVETSYLLAIDYATGGYTYYINSGSLATGITLSQTSLSINSDNTAQLSAFLSPEGAVGNVTWTSSNESVATVDANGVVTAIEGGNCTITATVGGSGVKATCIVTVVGEVHAYVDLDLPSGTLWATCNVGASSPEENGDYFAWGETTGHNDGKNNFDWSTYKWCKGSSSTLTKYCSQSSFGYEGFTDNKMELDLEDDAAYVNWGPAWRMPSKEQFEELFNRSYTTVVTTTQNGKKGFKVTSKSNGNSIFLRGTGQFYQNFISLEGTTGNYWTRSIDSPSYYAWEFYFNSSDVSTMCVAACDHCYGQSVRPVRSK